MYKRLLRTLIYLATIFLALFANLLPWRLSSSLGGLIGSWAYFILPKYRKIAQQNLALAFPEKNRKEIICLAQQSFNSQGRNLFELLSFFKLTPKKINALVSIEGRENLDKALSKGKGAIYYTGHLGNWELMAAWFALNGYPIRPIARRVYDPRLNNLLLKLRAKTGVQSILRSESPATILRVLKKKEILGILLDQNISGPGIYCNFFGHPAYTSSGLAAIARKTGIAVIPGFIYRRGHRHKLIIGEEIKLVAGDDNQEALAENTQIFTTVIEEAIRQMPGQWVWMHQRWDKTNG